MKKIFQATLLLVLTYATVSPIYAQEPDPVDDPGVDVPIDGGLSLLLAAGIGYGAKKAYDARKKNKQTEEK